MMMERSLYNLKIEIFLFITGVSNNYVSLANYDFVVSNWPSGSPQFIKFIAHNQTKLPVGIKNGISALFASKVSSSAQKSECGFKDNESDNVNIQY